MTPSARIQATIEILEALAATERPADRFIRDWFRARRYAGSKDRASITERVFAIFRHRASLARRMQNDSPRGLAIASLLNDGIASDAIEALFAGGTYAPEPLNEAEKNAILHPLEDGPLHVRGNFPEFLEPELSRAFGADLLSEVIALNGRASVDLRVNSLKSNRDLVLRRLGDDGFDASPTPYAPQGIRLAQGETGARLRQHEFFLGGAFEFQDEAAQIASHLVGAMPGETVLDLAAGAGGKSLAMASDMNNKGTILACDIRLAALEELRIRAARAGASLIAPHHIGEPPGGFFDAVLVDAPCSGSGTWRRQPDFKWRLTPKRLSDFRATQAHLLERAAVHVRPQGRLVYATCSVLPSENEDVIAAFLSAHPEFVLQPAVTIWSGLNVSSAPPGMDRCFCATPLKTGTDGFFAAILVRSAVS